jgi:hypothetical protein
MLDVSTLPEAISQAIKCDNILFERCHNKRLGSQIRVPSPYPAIPSNTINSQHEPMQIDSLRFKPLSQEGFCYGVVL